MSSDRFPLTSPERERDAKAVKREQALLDPRGIQGGVEVQARHVVSDHRYDTQIWRGANGLVKAEALEQHEARGRAIDRLLSDEMQYHRAGGAAEDYVSKLANRNKLREIEQEAIERQCRKKLGSVLRFVRTVYEQPGVLNCASTWRDFEDLIEGMHHHRCPRAAGKCNCTRDREGKVRHRIMRDRATAAEADREDPRERSRSRSDCMLVPARERSDGSPQRRGHKQ